VKPYKIGGTISDNILENRVGAMNIEDCLVNGASPTNVLDFGFRSDEVRIHEAQKPLSLIEFLIRLTTIEGQIVLDPFMGSGTTAIAALRLKRNYIGFEIEPEFYQRSLERIDNECGRTYSEAKICHQPMLLEKKAEYQS
jgi:site-specific DNA-methyltransferase (adenine-specific)